MKSSPSSSDFVGFAYSTLNHLDLKYSVIRLTTRTKSSIIIEGVLLTISGQDESLIESIWLENAEDPRLFLFGNKVYVYLQKAKIIEDRVVDCEIYFFDIKSKIYHEMIPPFNYSGKNWIPYEKDLELYFIYSLEPLVVLKVPIENLEDKIIYLSQVFGKKVPNLKWGDEVGYIGEIRGGTVLLKINESDYVSFTHITPKGSRKSDHYLGFLIYNSVEHVVRHLPITSQKIGRMFDPFGIDLEDDSITVLFSSSVYTPHWERMPVTSMSVVFSKSALICAVKENGVDISDI